MREETIEQKCAGWWQDPRARDVDARVLAAIRGVLRAGAPWPGNVWIGERIRHGCGTVSRSLRRLRERGVIEYETKATPKGRRITGLRIIEDSER